MYFCLICSARATLLHKIAHAKYKLFVMCSEKVSEMQAMDPTKPSTGILNDLLADNHWLDKLFYNIRNSWAEVDSLERQKRFN